MVARPCRTCLGGWPALVSPQSPKALAGLHKIGYGPLKVRHDSAPKPLRMAQRVGSNRVSGAGKI
jgi:hypothetical protein